MREPCSVEGCEKDAVARGWCPKHWYRWRKHGDPNWVTWFEFSIEERFWAKVDRADDACWLWTAGQRGDGYGAFSVGQQQIGAHRYSYELHHGEIPLDMVVMHTCDEPTCVNPEHLVLGTQADNQADSVRKGRRLPGSQNHNAKLNEEQVVEIRETYAQGGWTQSELAAAYGVSTPLIGAIVNRKAWRHI